MILEFQKQCSDLDGIVELSDGRRNMNMKTIAPLVLFSGLIALCCSSAGLAQAQQNAVPDPRLVYANQGWTAADRDEFYTTSQGSRLIPYDWFKGLQRVDLNESFGADQLKRYGYLPNERATNGLPVGFVVDTRAIPNQLGMTCAACHTGQIEYQKNGVTVRMRIDGSPAAAA